VDNRFLKEKIILILTIFLFFILGFSNSFAQDAASLGNSLGSQFNGAYASSGGINSKVIQPTMSNTPMTTLNGQTSFSAQLECPNSQAFLQIFFEPTSSGDFTAVVSQDPNLSGHFTYQLTTPLISGVCNNGFISCTQGTWNNCAYYQWTYNAGDVGYIRVLNDTTLGSCFCNNSSCGGSLLSQFNAVANTFGAGLASFIASNSQMAISNVQSSFPTLTYYGQNAQSCTAVAGNWAGSGYTNPAQYYKAGSALTGAGEDIMAQQSGQQSVVNGKTYNSPYNLISQNEYMNQNQATEKTCQISHLFNINISQGPTSGPMSCPSGSVPIASTCKWTSCSMQSQSTPWSSFTGFTVTPGTTYVIASDSSGWTGCYTNSSAEIKCGSDSEWREWPYSTNNGGWGTTTGWLAPGQTITYYSGSPGSSAFTTYVNSSTHIVDCMQISQSTNNSCAGQNFSKCKIKDEQICDQNGNNCVSVYQNYQYINPAIQPMCYSYSAPDGVLFNLCANGSSITYQDNNDASCPGYNSTIPNQGTLDQSSNNSDWWIVKKTYNCPSPQMTIPNLQREKMVEQQGTYNSASGVAVYPDVGTGAAGIQAYSGNNYQAKWSYNAPTTPCVYSCIVSIAPPRTAVLDAGVATTNNSSTGTPPNSPTIDKTYLACNQDPTTKQWTCPATGSEQIIQPCVCLDQGGQSIAIMSAMVSAGKDMICSQ
jgi:hypothetical protein